jgi:hypothetical protein
MFPGTFGLTQGQEDTLYSLDFNGTDEDQFSNTGAGAIGITNSWSISVWFQPDATDLTRFNRAFAIGPGSTANDIHLDLRGDMANDPLHVNLYDSGGTLQKNYTWDSIFSAGTYRHDDERRRRQLVWR